MAEHVVTVSDGRYVCTRCGAKLLTRMQFNSVECRDRTNRPVSAEFRLSDEQRALLNIGSDEFGDHLAGIVERIVASEVEAAERALVERMSKVAAEMDARARAFSSTGIGDAYANAASFICSALDIDRAALTHPDAEGDASTH